MVQRSDVTETEGLCQQTCGEYEDYEDYVDGDSTSDHCDGPAIQVVNHNSKWRKIWANTTVEPVLFALFLSRTWALGAVLTDLLLYKTCTIELGYNSTECSLLGSDSPEGRALEAEVEPHTALVVMGHNLIQCIPPAIMSFFLGPWSDLNGRKPLITLSLTGSMLNYVLLIVVAYVDWIPPSYVLIAAVPSALTGGLVTLISSCYCYVSDITDESHRALRMGVLEGFLFFGVLVGTSTCSYIYTSGGHYGYLIIFSLAALITAATALYVHFWVPESVPWSVEARGLRGAVDWHLIKELLVTCLKQRDGGRRSVILLTMLTLSFAILAMEGESNVSFLFTRVRFGWTLAGFTFWASIHLVVSIVGTIIGMIGFSKILKTPDAILGMLAFVLKACECTLYALLPSNMASWMYGGVVLGSLGGVMGPICRSILSKSVSKQDLGKVFSLMSSLESFAPIAASPLYTLVYKSTMHFLPGMFYFVSAVIYFINFIFLAIVAGILRCRPNANVPFESLPSIH